MGLLDRIKRRRTLPAAAPDTGPPQATVATHILSGDDDLDVVGEASYQGTLWAISGGSTGDRIRHDITAVLVPEPTNPYDPNAISIRVDGKVVGYLKRDQARIYLPGLLTLMARYGSSIALPGVIVGGGYHQDGPGLLGVFLQHDRQDFGLPPSASAHQNARPGQPVHPGAMRTGFSEAWRTDVEDDSYDLSWFTHLPEADPAAITALHILLSRASDPIDRHFQYSELEARLYRSRNLPGMALDDFDNTCKNHDAEMETICPAFIQKWGRLPLLSMYKQMAIRQQKKHDWSACVWWSERGLALYGNSPAALVDAVADLVKRRDRALSHLQTHTAPPSPTASLSSAAAPVTRRSDGTQSAQL